MRRSAAAALVAVALGFGACSGDGGDDDAPEAREDGTTTSTEPLHAEEELPDGRHFGQITALDPSQLRLVFDAAELAGDEVINADTRMHRLDLSPDVQVRLLDPCCELSDATFQEWLDGFEPDERTFYTTSRSWYWITLEDQEVVAVDEQFIPQE